MTSAQGRIGVAFILNVLQMALVSPLVPRCKRRAVMRWSRKALLTSALNIAALPAWAQSPKTYQEKPLPGKFVDVTSSVGVHFHHVASYTSQKYLIETMGPGVALFDYDNDGRLDLFVVNGGALRDPTPKGAVPLKTGPDDWNRLHQQHQDVHRRHSKSRS